MRRELLSIAIPAVVALLGGVLAAVWKPSLRARGLIQQFAAGVVLAALAVELLPEIEREHAPTLAFSAAALLHLVTEELLIEVHEVEEEPISTLVLFGGFLAFWSIQLIGR